MGSYVHYQMLTMIVFIIFCSQPIMAMVCLQAEVASVNLYFGKESSAALLCVFR